MLDWLKDNGAAVTALATAVIAASAVVTAVLTARLAADNRRLRKAGTEPNLVVYLQPDPQHFVFFRLVISNVGNGPAFDVSIRCYGDLDDLKSHGVKLEQIHDRLVQGVVPPGDSVALHFGDGREFTKNPPIKPFVARLRYTDIKGRSQEQSNQIDPHKFSGLHGPFTPVEERIAKAIEKIEQHLDR